MLDVVRGELATNVVRFGVGASFVAAVVAPILLPTKGELPEIALGSGALLYLEKAFVVL